jgi:hypothetical protein
MTDTYVHHSIAAEPRAWRSVADALATAGGKRLAQAGGSLFGIWRSQIGRPRDELTVITRWPHVPDDPTAVLIGDVADVRDAQGASFSPTLRPLANAPTPSRQGNYAFRWFELKDDNWDEFLGLCEAAWPGFEAAYDSQVIGLWRAIDADDGLVRCLLLTRRPDLAMWERSKMPANDTEAEVRRTLSRRYDLTESTWVYTTTLLTAADEDDTVRWT